MSHSFNRIWIHAVWATKERCPLIKSEYEKMVFGIVGKQLKELNCSVRIVNGMPDHIHCLFLLNPQKTVAEVIKQVKGSSSHFINQSNLLNEKFAWQTGYAAFSVSESGVEKVFGYIANQKRHHRKRTTQDEYVEFLRLHNMSQNG